MIILLMLFHKYDSGWLIEINPILFLHLNGLRMFSTFPLFYPVYYYYFIFGVAKKMLLSSLIIINSYSFSIVDIVNNLPSYRHTQWS